MHCLQFIISQLLNNCYHSCLNAQGSEVRVITNSYFEVLFILVLKNQE